MLVSNHLIGFGANSGNGPTLISFVARSSNDSATTTYSGHSIGTASSDRVVIVAAWARDSGNDTTITGVTIGGNAATQIGTATSVASGDTTVLGIYALLVTSGTTADIVASYSEAVIRNGIGVFAMTGTGGAVTAHDTGSANSGDPTSDTLNIPANGAAVAVAANGSGSSLTTTWAGLTEDWDDATGTNTFTGAHGNFTAAQTGLTVSADWSGAPSDPAILMASWG